MNNQSEKPIEELLRGIPQDHRICVPFQWAEDGRETGHHYIPVGRHAHRAVDEIAALREELGEMREQLAIAHEALGAAKVENTKLTWELTALRDWGEPVAIVADVYQSRYTLEWCGQAYSQGTKLYAKKEEGK
jgi:hypothetical protein